jgi:hypothetical protein
MPPLKGVILDPKRRVFGVQNDQRFTYLRHAGALGGPQNVGLTTCFKTLENSGFYPYNKPNIDFLGLSMPIDKE